MEIILIDHVAKLGKPGDVVEVKNGYARNFLFPRKKALRATEQNKAFYEAKRVEFEAQNIARKKQAEDLLELLKDLAISVSRQAGDDDRLYGSVTTKEIADLISAKIGQEFSHEFVDLSTKIKSVGVFSVPLVLHPEVVTTFELSVTRSESKLA